MSDETQSAPRPAQLAAADDPRILSLRRLVGVVDRLREPDGCPWDRKQTEASMAPSLIEEAHELQEAIEMGEASDVAEEAGDVLMNVALICRIGMEAGRFDLAQAAEAVSDKLIRRHPHVFGDTVVESTDEVVTNWEAIKKLERQSQDKDDSAMAGVPKHLPALQRSARMCEKAVSSGFKWADVRGAFDKIDEEHVELRETLSDETLAAALTPDLSARERERIEAELGDLLLATAFFAQYVGIDPEGACRSATRRFEARFRSMESNVEGALADEDLESLIEAWQQAKQRTQ